MVCPSCGGEFRAGFTRCRDCGVDLVAELPAEVEAGPEQEAPPGTGEREGAGASRSGEAGAEAGVSDAEDAGRSRRAVDLLVVLFVAFGTSLVTSIQAWWGGGGRAPVGREDSSLWRLVNASTAVVLLAYVLFRQGRRLRQIGLTAKLSDLPLSALVLALTFAPNLLARLLLPGSSYGTAVLHLGEAARGALQLPPLLAVSLLASAAREELLVRAYLITEVTEVTGNVFLAVAASACLQGLYHLYQGTTAAAVAAGSFLLCSIYYAIHRRATPLIVAHFLYNVVIYGYYPQAAR